MLINLFYVSKASVWLMLLHLRHFTTLRKTPQNYLDKNVSKFWSYLSIPKMKEYICSV